MFTVKSTKIDQLKTNPEYSVFLNSSDDINKYTDNSIIIEVGTSSGNIIGLLIFDINQSQNPDEDSTFIIKDILIHPKIKEIGLKALNLDQNNFSKLLTLLK